MSETYKNRRLSLTVTQDHIDRGIKGHVGDCALALALRELPRHESSTVGYEYCGGETTYDLPPDAQQFIDDFDAGRPVKPTTFELTLSRLFHPEAY